MWSRDRTEGPCPYPSVQHNGTDCGGKTRRSVQRFSNRGTFQLLAQQVGKTKTCKTGED